MISTYLFGQTFYTQFGEKKEIVGSKTYHDLGECYLVNSNYPTKCCCRNQKVTKNARRDQNVVRDRNVETVAPVRIVEPVVLAANVRIKNR